MAESVGAVGLNWPVKASFVRYVLGMHDGVQAVTEGATADADFVFSFPVRDTSGFDPATGFGLLHFTGAVRFGGHGGMLYVMIADPIVEITAAGALLSAKIDNDGERVNIVTLTQIKAFAPHITTTPLVIDAATALTAEGASLFIGQYPVGTAFDELNITLSS